MSKDLVDGIFYDANLFLREVSQVGDRVIDSEQPTRIVLDRFGELSSYLDTLGEDYHGPVTLILTYDKQVANDLGVKLPVGMDLFLLDEAKANINAFLCEKGITSMVHAEPIAAETVA